MINHGYNQINFKKKRKGSKQTPTWKNLKKPCI